MNGIEEMGFAFSGELSSKSGLEGSFLELQKREKEKEKEKKEKKKEEQEKE